MSPLAIAYLSTAAICLVVGLQQLVIALRVEGRRHQLWFTFAAFAVAGDAILEWRNYAAKTAGDRKSTR